MGSIFKEYGVKDSHEDDDFPVEVLTTWVHYLGFSMYDSKRLKREGERILQELKELVKKKKKADEEYNSR